MNKVEINFKVISANEDIEEQETYEYDCCNKYDENVTLEYVVKDLINKYAIPDIFGEIHFAIINLKDIWDGVIDDALIENTIVDYDSLKQVSLKKLEEQFDISKKFFVLEINTCTGGTGGVSNGVRFFFHTNEKDLHHRPHIHCEYGGKEMRIEIETLKILDKPFKNKSRVRYAKKIVLNNRDALLDYWNRVINKGESYKLILEF